MDMKKHVTIQIHVLQCTNNKASTFCKEVLLACAYIHLLKSHTQVKWCVLPQARWCGSQYKPCSTCYVAIFCVHICPENFILPFYSSFSRGVGERIKSHFFNGYGSCNYLFFEYHVAQWCLTSSLIPKLVPTFIVFHINMVD